MVNIESGTLFVGSSLTTSAHSIAKKKLAEEKTHSNTNSNYSSDQTLQFKHATDEISRTKGNWSTYPFTGVLATKHYFFEVWNKLQLNTILKEKDESDQKIPVTDTNLAKEEVVY